MLLVHSIKTSALVFKILKFFKNMQHFRVFTEVGGVWFWELDVVLQVWEKLRKQITLGCRVPL
jgi:hypothetical protein